MTGSPATAEIRIQALAVELGGREVLRGIDTVFEEGRFTAITRKEGLFDDVIHRIIEDDRGDVWQAETKPLELVARPCHRDHARLVALLVPAAEREASLWTVAPRHKAAASQAVKDYAKTKGAMPIAVYGKDAKELTERLATKEAWILFDSGTAAKSPSDLKIPR